MRLVSRQICLALTAAIPLFVGSFPAQAQTVTTYDLKVPTEVMGFQYAGAWQLTGPNSKPILVTYNGGDKGEASAMIYESKSAPEPLDDKALVQARDAFIERMGEKSNAAMMPVVVGESMVPAPELPHPSLAATHITTELGGQKSDLHYFMTAINGRLVGIRYKAPASAKTTADAKAFVLRIGSALKTMEAVR